MGSYLSVSGVFPQPGGTIFFPVMAMRPEQRQDLALQALAGTAPISRLATEHDVSRKFIYRQRARATDALHDAFFEEESRADEVSVPPPRDQGLARSIDPRADVDLS